jgi:hypothetical protein
VNCTIAETAILTDEWYSRPGQQCPKDGKTNILNKKLIFCNQKILIVETNKRYLNK